MHSQKIIILLSILCLQIQGISQNKTDLFSIIQTIEFENISTELKQTIISSHGTFMPDTATEENGDIQEYYNFTYDSISHTFAQIYYRQGISHYISYEIRLFPKTDGNYKVAYSEYFGMNASKEQSRFEIFDFNKKNKSLTKDIATQNLLQVKNKEFFKPHITDVQIQDFESYFGCFYNLQSHKGITYTLEDFSYTNDLADTCLKGYYIHFIWKNNNFIRIEPSFEE